jgi:hypothetical protein
MPRNPAQRVNYRQDVVALGRLAMAITLDDRITPEVKSELTAHLQALTNKLAALKLPADNGNGKAA